MKRARQVRALRKLREEIADKLYNKRQYEKTQKKDQAHCNKLEEKLKNILTNTENKEDLTNLDIDGLSEDKKGYVRSVI